MSFRKFITTAFVLGAGATAALGQAGAADLPAKIAKKAPAELPFFLLVDNRVTFSWMPKGTDPGVFSVRPDGSIKGTTAQQGYSFTHFDIWQYGTNFFTISLFKSDHNDPANPCTNAGVIFNPGTGVATPATCEGATEIYGVFRSTLGWNQIFNTNAFTMGPLRNISFEVGMDANSQNTYVSPAKRSVVAGVQFEFDLPYKGYFNAAPLLYYEFYNRNAFTQCGAGWQLPAAAVPGVNCLADGNRSFNPTWALELNYYMDLGFLPPNMQFWSISGRAGWYGEKGNENNPLPGTKTAIEFNSEPIRLTFDASKAFMGDKYSHFVDVWVAYHYWQNKFGLDRKVSAVCRGNSTCTEETLYAGVTVKF
ncbi:MAG: hypothetical protein E6614_16990 [Bradyrhizobium sp.]|jgi:hypothetical protein|uniref:Uncharacterized protein n=4 Tax=Pseudomonadota TaxID=1224 RepID=A0ABS5G2L2_9BRAD|nr:MULTISPECIES: hypothetical protein [Bradyrhizobium]ABQ34251.1 putative exported protein of unknown function [Bradyrhizobium sp. BTAi1]MBR1135542.1 hypothetical protein [Bradyrhizobium denitrificans]MDU1494861.1 hypothetical protein [Bradyrhizobium sp.]MDU1544982.1 hypothetical protein [Bradyrhizobium sp.]MDU1807833.1 hypothetical protein [Bradyrhizobium sp.]